MIDKRITAKGNVKGSNFISGDVTGNITNSNNNTQKEEYIAEVAAETQALLEQLEKDYPTKTTSEKMALAAQASTQIESNPNLKARIVHALKIGSVKAFEQYVNNPAVSFMTAALEDWKKTENDRY